MKRPAVFAATLLSSASLIALAQAEIIYAVVTVSRHGDRTFKGNPPPILTPLGQLQCHNSGTFYRSRYLNATSPQLINGISESMFDAQQVYAVAPDQPLLVTTGQAFLQGLYPPQTYTKPIPLANGEMVINPAGGLQYTTIHTVTTNDPDTIWLKADDGCNQYNEQGQSYYSSPEFSRISSETSNFYLSLKNDYLNGVFGDSEINYKNAFSIFDYINVGSIHNETIATKLSDGELKKLKYLADRHEWALNGNASSEHPALTIHGRAMAEKIVNQLKSNMESSGKKNKFSLMISSYDAFLAFFAHVGLIEVSANFMGLPNYAASMVFELFSDDEAGDDYPSTDGMKVRFLFRNGTEEGVPLNQYPIFGQHQLSWNDFKDSMDKFSIKDMYEWCEVCNAGEGFCLTPNPAPTSYDDRKAPKSSGDALSPVVAGVVGAASMLALCIVALGTAMAVFGVRFARGKKHTLEKGFVGGEKLPSDVNLAPSVMSKV